jgi:hypothetical protein
MTTPDHNESKPRRRWPTYLAAVIVLLLVVYPLSVGPAWVIACRSNTDLALHTVLVVYKPIGMILEIAPGTKNAYDGYIEWWLTATNTPHWS